MKYIFIDESGDLGKSSKNIVISAISVDDPTKLERLIIKANRYYKKLRKSNEIKGFNTPQYIIRNILKKLNKIDYEVHTITFNKDNKSKISHNYNNNTLYNILASKLAEIIPINEKTQIVIDRSKSNDKEVKLFDKMFKSNLNNPKNHQ